MLDETVFHGRSLAIVGSICRDVKIGAIPPSTNLLEDGETPTNSIAETLGGGGANSALAAAALGADVRFGGKVGADWLGKRLEESLRQHGVKTFIRHDGRVATGSSVVLSYQNGCRHFISCQWNNATLAISEVDLAVLAGGDHLLRADVWFSEPMLTKGNAILLEAARAQGLATSLDINWDPLWGWAKARVINRRKEAVRRVLPLVDMVHGNVRELNEFADSADLDSTLERITDWGAGAILVHMGADGAGYYDNGQWTVSPAIPVQEYRNTAGTGDLLSVCLMLLHRCDEIRLEDRLCLANTIVSEFIEGKRDIVPILE